MMNVKTEINFKVTIYLIQDDILLLNFVYYVRIPEKGKILP